MTAPRRFLWLAFVIVAGLSMTRCSGNYKSNAVSPPEAAADFSVSVNPSSVNVVAGGVSSPVNVSITAINGFTGSVHIALSGLPAGITASKGSFDVAAGSSQAITFTAASSAAAGSFTVSFVATSGSLSHTASAGLSISQAKDFSLSVQPSTLQFALGSTSSAMVLSVNALNGFTGNVQITLLGLPAGITSSPASPFMVAAGASQQINFTAASTAAPGSISLTFQGTSGSLSHSASAGLNISQAGDFSLSVQPSSLQFTQGSTSAAMVVSVNALNGFAGTVQIALLGLPAGITSSPASPFSVAAGASQQIDFTAASSVAPGSISITFQGTSGSLSHSASGALDVAGMPDFNLSVSPNMVAITQGTTSLPVVITANALYGFTGNIQVSISGFPSGVTVLPSASFQLAAGASQHVKFSVPLTEAPVSSISLSVAGESGSISHSTAAAMQILEDPAYYITYFDYAFEGAPDTEIRIQNPGVNGAPASGQALDSVGELCANIYVFDADQELAECCSCLVTANGEIQLDLYDDLLSNPGSIDQAGLSSGSVSVIAGTVPPQGCDATDPLATTSTDVKVWGAHAAVTSAPGAKTTTFKITETRASPGPLSGGELTSAASMCGFNVNDLSGAGVCGCSPEDASAKKAKATAAAAAKKAAVSTKK